MVDFVDAGFENENNKGEWYGEGFWKKINPKECGNIFKFIINIIIFKMLDNNNELVDIIDNLIDSSVEFISAKKRYTCSCLCQIS